MDTTGRDIARQVAVISATVFMIVAAVVGAGVLGGTPVQDLQDGALAADATLLAPAGPAFSIWTVVYVLLVAYAVWQALPGQRQRARQRYLGWWVAVTAVLNGLWLLLAQFATLPLTVVGIVLLLIALAVTFRRTVTFPSEGFADSLLVDGATGLHLGWVSLATVANITAWLTAEGDPSWAAAGTAIAVGVLIVVGIIGLSISWRSGWRIAPALAIAWGLSWVAVGRLQGEPYDSTVGGTAVIVAVVVLGVSVVGAVVSRVIDLRNAEA
ncbi:tryptophan-rich sensory protein [Microbacterium aoyamense]|uniref:Tryptophan-rich sensory protein n=1 Tax=Microbacterium aoyamense TaxID=344166 RepID=A0ABP5B4F3_9MICO|nr:tryptophan-rich sensory protein [Microbacterium aoyamense]